MFTKQPTTPRVNPKAAGNSARNDWRWLGWLILVLLAVFIVGGFFLAKTVLWPTELEQEIRLDLITTGDIDEQTNVAVLNELKLFSFYSRFGPQRFATLCLERSDGTLHLAYARCWREGMLWHTDSNRWRRLATMPSPEQIQAFEAEHADVVAPALKSGYLPRPDGSETFQLTHVSIQVSGESHGFEPNRDIDPEVFAAVLSNGLGPNSFASAKFHKTRWHSPEDGVEAIEKSIDHLQRILPEPECQALDCKSFLEVLNAVKERLIRAGELDLKFYFLGTDRSED